MIQFIKDLSSKIYSFGKGLYEYFFSLSFDDLNEQLKDSEVSQRLLFYPALKWHVTPGFIKNIIWASVVAVPIFLLGATIATPILIAFCLMGTALIASEANLVDTAIKGLNCKEKYQKIVKEEEAVIEEINSSTDKHNQKEVEHNIPDLEAQHSRVIELSDVAPVPRTRTQQLKLNQKFVAKKTAKTKVSLRESIEETNRFVSAVEKFNRFIGVNMAQPATEFIYVLHVRSISDLQEYCKNNILKLFLLFQKIQAKGGTVTFHIYQSSSNSADTKVSELNGTAKAPQLPAVNTVADEATMHLNAANEQLMLTDAINSVDEKDSSSLSVRDISDASRVSENSWDMSFSIEPKLAPSPLVINNEALITKGKLIAEQAPGNALQAAHWSLRLLNFRRESNITPSNSLPSLITLQPTVAVDSSNNDKNDALSLTGLTCQDGCGLFGTNLTVAGFLENDEQYQRAKKIVDSREPKEARQERLAREEAEFNALMASLPI